MKFFVSIFVCVGTWVWVSPAFAQTAGRFQQMYNFFMQAPVPARLSDFDPLGAPSKQECWIVDRWDRTSRTTIVRLTRATPPSGPLLPGVNEEKLVGYTQFQGSPENLNDILMNMFDAIRMSQNSYELMIDIPPLREYFDSPAHFDLRVNGNYIAVHLLTRMRYPDQQEYFGYCYRP